MQDWVVSADAAGMRLDLWLARHAGAGSRGRARRSLHGSSDCPLQGKPKGVDAMRESLEAIARRYYCDKVLRHTYIPHYERLFEPRRDDVFLVVEIGIGYESLMRRRVPPGGEWFLGASLRMWRDYFPKALVVGVDNQPSTMFEDERIRTLVANQADASLLKAAEFGPIDVVVDDGSHKVEHQEASLRMLLPHLRDGGLYVIEDVRVKDAEGLAQAVGGVRISSTTGKKWDDMVVVTK